MARTGHGTTDCFQIRKGVHQAVSSPCFFNLDAEHIMRNAGLDEAQAGIKIAGRSINNDYAKLEYDFLFFLKGQFFFLLLL